jgi:hypothetical protein
MERVLTYSEALEMDIDELEEVNAALDIHFENKRRAAANARKQAKG